MGQRPELLISLVVRSAEAGSIFTFALGLSVALTELAMESVAALGEFALDLSSISSLGLALSTPSFPSSPRSFLFVPRPDAEDDEPVVICGHNMKSSVTPGALSQFGYFRLYAYAAGRNEFLIISFK